MLSPYRCSERLLHSFRLLFKIILLLNRQVAAIKELIDTSLKSTLAEQESSMQQMKAAFEGLRESASKRVGLVRVLLAAETGQVESLVKDLEEKMADLGAIEAKSASDTVTKQPSSSHQKPMVVKNYQSLVEEGHMT